MRGKTKPLVLLLGLVALIWVSACEKDKSPLSLEVQPILLIPMNDVADTFGNRDGIASPDELNFIKNYFARNCEAWALGGFPTLYYNLNEVPATVVLDALKGTVLSRPYPSEKELRNAYKGVGIRTLWVGIYVFVSTPQYGLKAFYRSPGGYFSDHHWTQMTIVP